MEPPIPLQNIARQWGGQQLAPPQSEVPIQAKEPVLLTTRQQCDCGEKREGAAKIRDLSPRFRGNSIRLHLWREDNPHEGRPKQA